MSGSQQAVPWVALLICGFVCRTVSRLNRLRSTTSIADEAGETGETFAKVLDFLRVHKPFSFICENVTGLAEVDLCSDMLATFGYAVKTFILNGLEYGFPASRSRVYFVGIRDAYALDNVFSRMELTLAKIATDPLPLSAFFGAKFPSASSAASSSGISSSSTEDGCGVGSGTAAKRQRTAGEEKTPKWLDMHQAMFEANGLVFELPLDASGRGAEFELLPLRESSIVQLFEAIHGIPPMGHENSDFQELVADLNMSLDRARVRETVGCISTGYKGWKLYARQLVSVEECLALQGIEPERFRFGSEFSQNMLMVIAGEAFVMPAVTAIVLSLLAHVKLPSAEPDIEIDAMTKEPVDEEGTDPPFDEEEEPKQDHEQAIDRSDSSDALDLLVAIGSDLGIGLGLDSD